MLITALRDARRSKGWTQELLGSRIGCQGQTIKRLEAGIGSARTLDATMNALELRLVGVGLGATLAEQLRYRRVKRGLSLQELARRTRLSRTTIAAVERGGGSLASVAQLLSYLAPKASRRAPERAYWGQGDKLDRDSRFTPPDFLEHVEAAFGPIDLDPCGHRMSPVNARKRILLEEGGDGLVDDWQGRLVFMNPPYSALLQWLRRAHEQWSEGNVGTVVCLVPVRTDSEWFHTTLAPVADIFLLQGRVRFLNRAGKAQPTPFSLMLVTLGASREARALFSGQVSGRWIEARANGS